METLAIIYIFWPFFLCLAILYVIIDMVKLGIKLSKEAQERN